MSEDGVCAGFPVRVVCPRCQGALRQADGSITCAACGSGYGFEDEFANLIVGERFADETPDCELAFEERSSGATTRSFWIPLFQRLACPDGRELRVLSLGCGVGAEVDELGDAGIAGCGVDCGNRTRVWKRRRFPERLLLANGMALPFEDDSFDVVFCGCVFPHVGVEGDSYRVVTEYRAERLRLAKEAARVLAPRGILVAASPNRLFPLDLFHRGSGVARLNRFRDPFLLSAADYAGLFLKAGLENAQALTPRHYWSLHRSRETLQGRILGAGVNGLFRLNSGGGWLRTGALAPWIVMSAQRPAGARSASS